MLKFGRMVDLDRLEKMADNRQADVLKAKVRQTEVKQMKELSDLDSVIKDTQVRTTAASKVSGGCKLIALACAARVCRRHTRKHHSAAAACGPHRPAALARDVAQCDPGPAVRGGGLHPLRWDGRGGKAAVGAACAVAGAHSPNPPSLPFPCGRS